MRSFRVTARAFTVAPGRRPRQNEKFGSPDKGGSGWTAPLPCRRALHAFEPREGRERRGARPTSPLDASRRFRHVAPRAPGSTGASPCGAGTGSSSRSVGSQRMSFSLSTKVT